MVLRLLDMCCKDTYIRIHDFEWLTGIFLHFLRLESIGDSVAREISCRFVDIAARVPSNRAYLVDQMVKSFVDFLWICLL